MATTMPLRLPSMPLHSVESDGELSSHLVDEVDLVELLEVAIDRAGLMHKQAAAEMGIDASQLTRQFQKREHLSLQRASRLPLGVQREFCLLLAARCGLVLTGAGAEAKQREALARVADAFANFLRVGL